MRYLAIYRAEERDVPPTTDEMAAMGALGALALAIYAGPVAEIFRFGPLSPGYLAAAAAAGCAGVLWYEVYKLARPRHRVAG